jgi:hypothetical protein
MEQQLKDLVEVLHYRIANGNPDSDRLHIVDGLPVKVQTGTDPSDVVGMECNVEVQLGESNARVQLIVKF